VQTVRSMHIRPLWSTQRSPRHSASANVWAHLGSRRRGHTFRGALPTATCASSWAETDEDDPSPLPQFSDTSSWKAARTANFAGGSLGSRMSLITLLWLVLGHLMSRQTGHATSLLEGPRRRRVLPPCVSALCRDPDSKDHRRTTAIHRHLRLVLLGRRRGLTPETRGATRKPIIDPTARFLSHIRRFPRLCRETDDTVAAVSLHLSDHRTEPVAYETTSRGGSWRAADTSSQRQGH